MDIGLVSPLRLLSPICGKIIPMYLPSNYVNTFVIQTICPCWWEARWWKSGCSVALRRMQAFYRGLGTGPAATPILKKFASQAQTINSCRRDGSFQGCCSALFCKSTDDSPACPWEKVGAARLGIPRHRCRCMLNSWDMTVQLSTEHLHAALLGILRHWYRCMLDRLDRTAQLSTKHSLASIPTSLFKRPLVGTMHLYNSIFTTTHASASLW